MYIYIYISRVRERVKKHLYFEMSPREKKLLCCRNILLASYGLRSIGFAVQDGAWKSEDSTVRDLATVERNFLSNNYHNDCSMLPMPLFSEHFLLHVTVMTFDTSV